MSFPAWLADRLILQPRRHDIHVLERRPYRFLHGDGELEVWIHRIGLETHAALRHGLARPQCAGNIFAGASADTVLLQVTAGARWAQWSARCEGAVPEEAECTFIESEMLNTSENSKL